MYMLRFIQARLLHSDLRKYRTTYAQITCYNSLVEGMASATPLVTKIIVVGSWTYIIDVNISFWSAKLRQKWQMPFWVKSLVLVRMISGHTPPLLSVYAELQ